MPPSLEARQRRALARAFSWGLQAEVRPVDRRHWRVPSIREPGLLYDVALTTRDGREHLACSCPAGVADMPCAHAAAVWLWRTEQMTGGSVIGVRPG